METKQLERRAHFNDEPVEIKANSDESESESDDLALKNVKII